MKIKLSQIFALMSGIFFLITILGINVQVKASALTGTRPLSAVLSSNQATVFSWQSQGIEICTENYSQGYPEIIYDGTGIIIVWQDYRSNNYYDIYAQKGCFWRCNRVLYKKTTINFPFFS